MTTFDDEIRAARAPVRGARALPERFAERLGAGVAEAGRRARAAGRPVLVSVVGAAAPVDPLDVLDALGASTTAAARRTEFAAVLRAGCAYWTRPSERFAFAGVGAAATFAPEGAERFATAERAWDALLDEAVIDDPSDRAQGAGPVAIGGFAFDPEGPRDAHWRGFPSARLTLPRVQLAAVDGAHWVTANVVVGPGGEPDAPLALVGRLAARVLAPAADARRDAVVALAAPGSDGALALADVVDADAWRALVGEALAAIRAGQMQKVVLARAVRAAAARPLDVVAALRQLRAAYPDCYVFGCWGERLTTEEEGAAFVGASPERLVRLDGRRVRATSLAGSAPRGATEAEGAAHAAALLASAKDRAEHAIVRQSLVRALGELCDDVRAAPEPSLRALANVYHLHTDVTACLRPGRSLFDLLARLHPTPAVGGAPREVALRFLREREPLDRGWYAGPIGWVGRDGGEFAVGLRSALVRGAEAWLFAGCGIVADSDPAREYAESRAKLGAMGAALAAAATAASPPAAAPVAGDRAG